MNQENAPNHSQPQSKQIIIADQNQQGTTFGQPNAQQPYGQPYYQ